MVSREEYIKFIKDLTQKDADNKNLQYIKKGSCSSAVWAIVIGSVISFLSVTSIVFTKGFGLFLLPLGVVFIVVGVCKISKISKTIGYYKDNYREKVLDYLLKDYKYSLKKSDYIDSQIYIDSQFGGSDYDDYYGSDKFTINIPNDDGSESEINLIMSDLDVTKTVKDDEGNNETQTLYSGILGYVDFPFEFKHVLGINEFYYKKGVKCDKVVLEDIVFNKEFIVWCDDQIEARYILTPEIMEKLMKLKKILGSVSIVMVDKRMYIGFEYCCLFELSRIKDNGIEDIFGNLYDEVVAILSIVNEIKNNNKIFKI